MRCIKYLFAFLMFTSIAKADGFNPAEVYPGEIVFDYTLLLADDAFVHWDIEVLDTAPAGADFWGFCQGPYNPATGTAFPYCTTDEPIQGFEPAGGHDDIATLVFGFDPGNPPPASQQGSGQELNPTGLIQPQSLSVSTPEPSSLYLVGICGLLSALCIMWSNRPWKAAND